jgi:hypothetical protein
MCVKIDLESTICPSCGQDKKVGNITCFYCYYRSRNGAVKLLILKCLDELNRSVTVKELVEYMNAHKINDGRREFHYIGVINRLENLSHKKHGLVRKWTRKNGVGRPVNVYRISHNKGKRMLEMYQKNWERGMTINVRKKKYEAKWYKHKKHVDGIRANIFKNKYDLWDFIFVDGMKNNPKFHASPNWARG